MLLRILHGGCLFFSVLLSLQSSAHPILSSTSNPLPTTGLVPVWIGFGSGKGATVSSTHPDPLLADVLHRSHHSPRHRLTGSGETTREQWAEQTVWAVGSHHRKLLQVGGRVCGICCTSCCMLHQLACVLCSLARSRGSSSGGESGAAKGSDSGLAGGQDRGAKEEEVLSVTLQAFETSLVPAFLVGVIDSLGARVHCTIS